MIVHPDGPPRDPWPGPSIRCSGVDAYDDLESPKAVRTWCTTF